MLHPQYQSLFHLFQLVNFSLHSSSFSSHIGSNSTSSSVASACGVVAAFVAMIVAAVLVCLYWKKLAPANKFSVHMLTEPVIDVSGDDIPRGDVMNRPTSPTQSLQSI
jgi:hypothetical protein